VTTKSVDKSGRLYLGKDYAGKTVRLVIEQIDDTDNEPSEESESDESAFARELSRQSIANQYADDYFSTHPDSDDDLPDLGENA
jgi:hypothetical protein